MIQELIHAFEQALQMMGFESVLRRRSNAVRSYGSSIVGSVLTGNAALLLERARDGSGKLHALARHNGSERWQITLPGTPVHDGLAVAADGSVVVQLLDGNVVAVPSGWAETSRVKEGNRKQAVWPVSEKMQHQPDAQAR